MLITDSQLSRTTHELRTLIQGDRELAFAYLHLQDHFGLSAERARAQLMIGGRGAGLTAFHYDREDRNLYLLVHRWARSLRHLREPFDTLVQRGFAELFPPQSPGIDTDRLESLISGGHAQQAPLPNLSSLRATLTEHQDSIKRVIIGLVFYGQPDVAKTSPVWSYMDEELTSRKHLVSDFLGSEVKVLLGIVDAYDGAQVITTTRPSQRYELELASNLDWATPSQVHMRIGFVRLATLGQMHRDIGVAFFESNVRAGLAEDEAPNRAISAALRQIVVDGTIDPQVFAFNHNGVTLSVESLSPTPTGVEVVNPRLLNGAQTVSTFTRFMDKEGIRPSHPRLKDLRVLAKIIRSPDDRFTAQVTINNNRQNPVMPWDLRANDPIQLEVQEWLRDTLGIFYERQANAFAAMASLPDDARARAGITSDKPIGLVKLAATFLAIDGRVDKMGRMKEVFEDDRLYQDVFRTDRMKANPRAVVFCYKIDRCIAKLLKELNDDNAAGRYAFLYKGRNLFWALLCQATVNDSKHLDDNIEMHGEDLVITQSLRSILASYAQSKVRPILNALVAQDPYKDMMQLEKYGFLSTKSVFERAMDIGAERYGWKHLSLPRA
jgi:hypothetical protein